MNSYDADILSETVFARIYSFHFCRKEPRTKD